MNAETSHPASTPAADDQVVAQFRDAFAESVSFLDAPENAAVPQSLLAVQGTSQLLATLIEIGTALGKEFTAYLPQLKVALLAVYDTKIAPLDLPWVPNSFEPIVDAMLRQALEQGIESLIAGARTYTVSQTAAAARVADIRAGLVA